MEAAQRRGQVVVDALVRRVVHRRGVAVVGARAGDLRREVVEFGVVHFVVVLSVFSLGDFDYPLSFELMHGRLSRKARLRSRWEISAA